jgi:hypothetical protein
MGGPGSPTSYRHSLAVFRDGLTAAGYVEGQNIRIEYRWAEGNVSRLPELARDLVHQQVDVILAGGSVGAEAAKRATSIIPIIAAGVGDLVELGLVSSLARPNGNLTGFVATAPEIAGKRFQIVKEIRPDPMKLISMTWWCWRSAQQPCLGLPLSLNRIRKARALFPSPQGTTPGHQPRAGLPCISVAY